MRQPQEISFTSPKMLRSWVVGLTSLIVLTACSATAADATQPTAKRYSSCEKLLQDFPQGVAQSKPSATKSAKAGAVKPDVSAAVYRANSRLLDKNRDGVMCESTRTAKSFAPGISSAQLLDWVKAVTSEMSQPPRNFLGLIWPVGRPLDDQPDPDVFDGAPFSEHADVLNPKQIRAVTDYFSSWQSGQQDCTASERREFSEGARTVERWIKGAADVATAPGPCRSSRSAILAWTAEQDRDTARRIFFHESYHAMQNYLLDRCAPILKRNEDSMNDLRWFSEGTAEYFGEYMSAKQDGRTDHVQRILQRASDDLRGDPGISLDSNAYVQAAAMVLMMEKGMISERRLADGSYFHDCDWINDFDPSRPEIATIFDDFDKIENSGGRYFYSDEAISG